MERVAGASERVDLCVIGAGPAGIAAAQKGLELGASVALIEPVEMGGVALNWGALPAQILSASARRAHDIRNAADVGIGANDPRINFARLNAHIRSVIEAARPDVSAERLGAMGADVIRHPAIFLNRSTIEAGERRIRARRFIVATGSRPYVPQIPGLDEVPYFTPETIFELTRRPGHLIIIGAGATGTALAQAHIRLGAKVTLIDMLSPLSDEDPEFTALVTETLADEGVEIVKNTGVVSVAEEGEGIRVTLKSGADEHAISGTHLLVATGRTSNLDTLDLGKAGVAWTQGRPALDRAGRTANRRIYCVGDAAGTRTVAAARTMGAWAATHALSALRGMAPPPIIPRLIATDPEIAAVGLTEPEALAKYKGRIVVTRYGFAGLDRARARGDGSGHVKLITTENGRIVGAGMCGDGAGELAAPFALAIAQRLTPFDLCDLIAPYPALGEVVPLVAEHYVTSHRRSGGARALAALKRLLP